MTQEEVEEKLQKHTKCCLDFEIQGGVEMYCFDQVWVYGEALHGKRKSDGLYYHIPVASIKDLSPGL